MKKIVLSVFASSLLFAGGWIEENIIDVSTDSGYYETQTRNIYSLGSKTIKFKEVGGTITPFHIEPPRFNVGCGGIDISMGGFSYLKKEFIVEKLKAISAAAPAFVYQMAISALCKDCQNIMNELENAANMINGLNFDTCDAINAAQGAGKQMGDLMNSNIFHGESDSWTAERLKSGRETIEGWGRTLKSAFGGDDAKAKEKMATMLLKGSLLHMSLTKGLANTSQLDILGNDPNGDKLVVSIFRSLIGDVIGGEDGTGIPTVFKASGGSKDNLFKALYEGGKVQYMSYNTTTFKLYEQNAETETTGAKKIIKDKLIDIYTKMKNKTPLNITDKKFLATLSFPVYKYLNVSVLSKGSSDVEIELMAEQIAANQTAQLVYYMTNMISRGMQMYLANHGKDLAPENIEAIANDLTHGIDEINKAANEYVKTISIDFTKKVGVVELIRKQEQEFKTKFANQPFVKSIYTK